MTINLHVLLAFSSKSVTRESKTVKYFWAGAWLQWSTIYSFVIHGWKCLIYSSRPLPEGLYSTHLYVIHTLLWKIEGKEKMSLGASHACGRCEVLSLYDRGTIQRQRWKKSIGQLGGIPPHWSVRQKGEERSASWELLDFVQSRKIICSLHLPHHHMLPLKLPPSWLERTRIWRDSCIWSPGLSETSSCIYHLI